ncbi:hypothetical protein ACT80S_14905 [Ramlibacter sp. MAHUQ-53]|uniref:hypothetical protein n=1 Tax=unclassified Ramlibacter TaxID=2617605 RepID=UPI00363CA7A5
MSTMQVGGNTPVAPVESKPVQRLDPPMLYMLALAERTQVVDMQMESMIKTFSSTTQRIKDFTELKSALQDLDGLCSNKKPNEDIKAILDANPALKTKIDNLSSKLGVQPFESTAAIGSSTVTSSTVVAAEEPLPALAASPEVLEKVTPEILTFLTDAKARERLMRVVPFTKDTYVESKDAAALTGVGGPVLLDEVRTFLKSPAGKALASYTDRHGDRGDARLRQEMAKVGGGAAGEPAASVTSGVIPKSQIQAALTRIQGESDSVSAMQQIETMRLTQTNNLRTTYFEGMATMNRTQREVFQTIFGR